MLNNKREAVWDVVSLQFVTVVPGGECFPSVATVSRPWILKVNDVSHKCLSCGDTLLKQLIDAAGAIQYSVDQLF